MLAQELPTGLFDSEDMSEFWSYVWWFIGEFQMWIMLGLSVMLAAAVVGLILSLFNPAPDDEDYEYREL